LRVCESWSEAGKYLQRENFFIVGASTRKYFARAAAKTFSPRQTKSILSSLIRDLFVAASVVAKRGALSVRSAEAARKASR
jgi:hypothetical protein